MKHRKTIEQDVFRFVKKHSLLSDAKKILIGLSGGADSVFALHFFCKFKTKYNLNIAALHVNHNLRGSESIRDEEFCRKLCEDLEIEFHCSHVNVSSFAKNNKKSVEEAARDLRYKEFEKTANLCEADLVVTSHNSNDNTETVLLNIVNGTSLSGISGIPIKREKIIRPFLCLSKDSIVDFLNSNGIKFVEDSSNNNVDYKRNFLRSKIIPELKENINPSIDKTILQSSEVFRNQTSIINYFIDEIYSELVSFREGEIEVFISQLEKYPKEILGEFFKKILNSNFEVDYSYNQFEKLFSLITAQVGTKIDLGSNILAFRERDKIVISKMKVNDLIKLIVEPGKKIKTDLGCFSMNFVDKLPEKFNKSNKIEFISGDLLKDKLVLRNWILGDKIQLLGMKGTKKVSDVLTDLKIPSRLRKSQLVLVNNDEIVWIVGQRISEKYKVSKKTKKIIKVCLN